MAVSGDTLSGLSLLLSLGPLGLALAYGVVTAEKGNVADWNVCVSLIGLVALIYWLRAKREALAPPVDRRLRWLVVLAPAYIVFQLIPLPLLVLNVISPVRAQDVANLGTVMAAPQLAALSINPVATVPYLVNIAACTVAFLLVRDICWGSHWHRRWAPVIPVIAIGAIEAGLGLMQAANGAEMHGTYPNKNNFAGLLDMVLPIAVASGIALLGVSNRREPARVVRTLAGVAVLSIAVLIGTAAISSLSKGGFAASMCGLFAMGALALFTTLHGTKKWISVAGLGALCLLLLLLLPSDRLVSAFGELITDATGEGRWPVWRDTLQVLKDYPLFGCGLGNYGTAFLKHQTASIGWAVTFAHNDYLQLASELGVVGFAIFIALMLSIVAKAIRAAIHAHDWDTRVLSWGWVGAIAAIAVHSLVDFNMYIPATPLVLAWIAGIAVSVPVRSAHQPEASGSPAFHMGVVVMACLVVAYASARVMAESTFKGNLAAERWFCLFGICDTGGVLQAQTSEHGGDSAAVPIPELLEALRRDPASSDRWCTLGEAKLKAGQVEQARTCFLNALALGPNDPPSLFRAARFYYEIGEHKHALAQTSRTLENTERYDSGIFDWYTGKKASTEEILSDGLGTSARPSRAYLRYQIEGRDFDRAAMVWNRLLSHHFVDVGVARDYVNFLYDNRRFESAARSWALYLGDRAKGYLETTWLFNGDFELESAGTRFDWTMWNLNDDVEFGIDRSVARSRARSLRIRFAGKENVSYSHVSETTFLMPGIYRFQAFVRAHGITTDQGVAFHIFDAEDSRRLDVRTDQVVGTTEWKPIEQTVRVSPETKLLTVQVVRQKSLKFDSQIAGTAWIDDVSLIKIQ